MGKWQPIETAPKDGMPILVYDSEGVELDDHTYAWPRHAVLHVLPAIWKKPNGRSADGPGWFAPMFWLSFGVWDDPSTDIEAIELRPTHWMPLPIPPTPERAEP